MKPHIITCDSITAIIHRRRYVYIIDLEGCFKIYCQVNKASLYEKNRNNIKSHMNRYKYICVYRNIYKIIHKLLSLIITKSRIWQEKKNIFIFLL